MIHNIFHNHTADFLDVLRVMQRRDSATFAARARPGASSRDLCDPPPVRRRWLNKMDDLYSLWRSSHYADTLLHTGTHIVHMEYDNMVIFRSYSSFGTISWNRLIFLAVRAQFVSQGSPPDLPFGTRRWHWNIPQLMNIDDLPSESSNFRQPSLITGRSIRFHPIQGFWIARPWSDSCRSRWRGRWLLNCPETHEVIQKITEIWGNQWNQKFLMNAIECPCVFWALLGTVVEYGVGFCRASRHVLRRHSIFKWALLSRLGNDARFPERCDMMSWHWQKPESS